MKNKLNPGTPIRLDKLLQSRRPGFHILFPMGNGKTAEIPLFYITHIEAEGALSVLHLNGYKLQNFRIAQSIGDCVKQLGDYAFVRIHRTYVVNLSWIQKLTQEGNNWCCHMHSGEEIPISRRQQKPFFELIDALKMNRLFEGED